MPVARVIPLALVMSCLLIPTAWGQGTGPTPGVANIDSFGGSMSLTSDGGTYFLFDKWVGDGVGIRNSYQRLGFRTNLYDLDDYGSHLFTETHLMISDHSRLGYNLGGGVRWEYDGGFFGVNGFYDETESVTGHRYRQATVGAEYRHDGLDIFANGYIPLGDGREHLLGVLDPAGPSFFRNYQILTLGTGLVEEQFGGFDTEAGIPIPGLEMIRMYAGTYYLESDRGDGTWGVRSRAEARVGVGTTLNFLVTNDKTWGTNLNFQAEVRFWGDVPFRLPTDFSVYSRRFDPVRRAQVVQTNISAKPVPVPVMNPRTNLPWIVWHVDNTNPNPGTGSFEDPSQRLPSMIDTDLILVRTGVGDTLGNTTLVPFQQLLGEGKTHFIDTTTLGTIPLPESFARTGPFPTLRPLDPSQNIVTLSNNNRVVALNMIGSNAAAIGGMNVNNFYIECVHAQSTNGVQIFNANGLGVIRDSTFDALGLGTGVFVSNSSGTPLLLDFDDVHNSGGARGFDIVANGGPITLQADNISSDSNSNAGFRIAADASVLTADVNNAIVTNSGGRGFVQDVSNGGRIDSTFDNISATGAGNLFEGNVVAGGILNTTVTGGTFDGSTGGHGIRLNLQGATGTANFFNISASNNAIDGLNAVADMGSDYNLNVLNSTLVNNADDSFDVTSVNLSRFNVFYDPSDSSGSGDNGFEFLSDSGSVLISTFIDIDLSNSTSNAVFGRTLRGSSTTLNFLRVNMDDAQNFNGMALLVDENSTFFGTVTDSSIRNAGFDNLGIQVSDGSTATLNINNTPADVSGNRGLAFIVDDGPNGPSVFNLNVTDSNLNDHPTANIIGMVVDGSQANLAFNNVTADNMGVLGGFNVTATNGSIVNSTWEGGSISNTGFNGVTATVSGPGPNTSMTMSFDGVAIDGNAADGVHGRITADATLGQLSISLTDSSLVNNLGDGMDVVSLGLNSTTILNLADTPVTGNAGHGVSTEIRNSSTGIFTLSNVQLDNNGTAGVGDGFRTLADQTSIVTANFNIVSANNNQGNGYRFVADNESVVAVNFAGNSATARFNGQNGLSFDVFGGSFFGLDLTGGDFSDNGLAGNFSGVRGLVDGVGPNFPSRANVSFDGTLSDRNTNHGFEFVVSNGGNFAGALNTSGLNGTLSASDNFNSGVSFIATDAGTVAGLLMSGENVFNNNGLLTGADGVFLSGTDVDLFIAGAAGTVNNSGGHGIHVDMNNVALGAINLLGNGTGTVNDNQGHGIFINLVDSTLANVVFNSQAVPAFNISGFAEINNNLLDGINIAADNTSVGPAVINGNTLSGNVNGILVNLTNGSDWDLSITNNNSFANDVFGIAVFADSGLHTININDNLVNANADTNIFADFSGTADAELHIDRNQVNGGGIVTSTFAVGTNFLGTTQTLSGANLPDTAGAVGPGHVVELVNGRFAVYNKAGAPMAASTLNAFWDSVLGIVRGGNTFNPRVIFDPTIGRFIATAIDGGPGNTIYIAISDTNDPTGTWRGVQFVGDTIDGTRFNDFDSLGVDADGVYIATRNFGIGFDVSVFSIPKADLLLPVPTLANMTRFEGLNQNVVGNGIQPTVNFGPSDGSATLLSAFDAGGNLLVRSDLTGTGGPGAALGAAQNINVINYAPPTGGRQPVSPDLVYDTSRFNSSVVEVAGSLWAVHGINGALGNAEVRWYQIDANTNAILQTGVISDPNLDFLYPSIAVNNVGTVIIGYTMTGPAQAPSSAASFGTTSAGVTSFQAPQVLQAGTGDYFVDLGNGNLWGEYSSTVVDPANPNTFWTFQERVVADDVWGIQITEINFSQTVTGVGTANEGIRVVVRDAAHLSPSTINDNIVQNNGGHNIEVALMDLASVDSFNIDGNVSNFAGEDGIHFETSGTVTLGGLSISNNPEIGNNSDDGIDVILTNFFGTPDVLINNNGNIHNNFNRGISLSITDTVAGGPTSSVGLVSTSFNGVTNNSGAILINIEDFSGDNALAVDEIDAIGNDVTFNGGTGLDILLRDLAGVNAFTASTSTYSSNIGGGISLRAFNSDIMTSLIATNAIEDNQGGDGILFFGQDSLFDTVSIINNGISRNNGDGIDLDLNNSPINFLEILDHSAGSVVNIGLDFLIIGNTFPGGVPSGAFTITNTSDPGIDVTSFFFDIGPSGNLYDTTGFGGFPFTPFAGTEVITGLVSVNGFPVPPFAPSVPDGTSIIDAVFANFNPGESFRWDIDADPFPGFDATVLGSDLVGSTITVNFTGGLFLSGALFPVPGQPTASQFVSTFSNNTPGGITENQGSGIRLSAVNGSNIGFIDISDNFIDANTNHGIEFLIQDSTLPGPGAPSALISGNTVSNHAGGNGFQMVLPDTNNNPIGIDFINNNINNNVVGINVQLNDSENLTSVMTGNIVSNNAGFGARFLGQQNSGYNMVIGDVTADGNIFDNNVDAGIAFELTDNTVSNILVENTVISNTTNGANPNFNGDGLAVHTAMNATINNLLVGSVLPGDTSTQFINNAGDGFEVQMIELSTINNLFVSNLITNFNNGHGIRLERRDASTLSGVFNALFTDVTSSNNGLNGFDLLSTNAQLPVQRIDFLGGTYNNNGLNGWNFLVQADSIVVVQAADATLQQNNLHGVNVLTTERATFGNVLPSLGDPTSALAEQSIFSSMNVSSNGVNGFNLISNANSVQTIRIDDAGLNGRTIIDGNTNNGIQITGNITAPNLLNLNDIFVRISGTDITNLNGVATNDGINIDGNITSTMRVDIFDTLIGATIPTNIFPGMGGNGIIADISGGTQLVLNIGMDTGDLNTPDVRIYNNALDGVQITNTGPTNTQVDNRQALVVNMNSVHSQFNDDQGLDIRLTGNIGGRGIQGDNDAPVLINVNRSRFDNNQQEGIFYQTNTGVYVNSQVQLSNNVAPAPADPVVDNLLPPYDPRFNVNGVGRNGGGFTNGFQTTTRSGVFNNANYNAGTPANPISPWNNLYADMVVTFSVTNSSILNNGVGGVGNEHGFLMRMSTNSYTLANVSNNIFGGNALDDFRTESFITTDAGGVALQPGASINTTGAANFDTVFLDDTAQLDLAFQGNVGDQINVTALGAFYTNNDPAKQNSALNGNNNNPGPPGSGGAAFTRATSATNRRADWFVLDNALTVEANNTFIQFGVPQAEVFGPLGFFGPLGVNGYLLRIGSNPGSPTFPPTP